MKLFALCARKSRLENRFSVYVWRAAIGKKSFTELLHNDGRASDLFVYREHLCFGNRMLINKL